MIDTHASYPGFIHESRPTLVNEVRVILSTLRRHIRLILMLVPIGLLLGMAVSYLQTPLYDASTQITLDPRRVAIGQSVNAQTQKRDEPLIDTGRADTEVQTMRSEVVIRSVVTSLVLQNDPEFTARPMGLRATITSFLSKPKDPPTEEQRIMGTIAAVARNLKVERVALSYSFVITYSARNPAVAARVANAFANAYIQQQLNADFEVTGQAVQWLKQRTDDLAQQTIRADAAASEYQNQARIARSDGKLIDETRLVQLSEQLADAQSQRAEAQARYEGARKFSSVSPDQMVVTDSFQNSVISKLRDRYLELRVKGDGLAARYGENHAAVMKMRADASAVENSIRQELLRYQESYKNDYDVAVARETELRRALDEQSGRAAQMSEAQVKLNSLEADAKALREAYDGFMQRYTEAMQRQSFPVSEARIISPATTPSAPARPKRSLFAAGGMVLGLLGGIGLAFGMEIAHRRIRTRAEAEDVTGVECFGYVPKIVPDRRSASGRLPSGRSMALDYAVQNPYTVATETLRTVKTTLDQRGADDGGCPVLGVVSCVPDEGKTSISANLAFLFAQNKRRVLLIDGDMRNPSLSDALASTSTSDEADGAVLRTDTFSVIKRPDLPFHFIPALSSPRAEFQGFTNEARSENGAGPVTSLEADRFGALIRAARGYYDYIIVDLPPIVPLSDVRAVSRSITSFTMVMAWGKSQANVVGDAIDSVPGMSEKLIGTILNMADIKSLGRYGEYVSTYYNSKYFSQ